MLSSSLDTYTCFANFHSNVAISTIWQHYIAAFFMLQMSIGGMYFLLLSFQQGRNTFCPISGLARQKYLSGWQKTNPVHKLLFSRIVGFNVISVQHFRNGRETENIFSKNEKFAYPWYVFSIVTLFLALAVTTTVCPISAQQKTNRVK